METSGLALSAALCANSYEARHSSARVVSLAAVRALYHELCLYPKPGLVSKIDNGSHQDMNAEIFIRSLFSLRHYFAATWQAGFDGAPFTTLRQLGIAAEARMLRATSGVNTHRGAIFNLGVLAATAGHWEAQGCCGDLAELAIALWGDDIKRADNVAHGDSHGARACRSYAVGGARGEAAAGFPNVFKIGLPALRTARAAGASETTAIAHVFFSILAELDDTNLLHRGGPAGLAFARTTAAQFMQNGGALARDWRADAVEVHRQFVELNLSPGGSADLLAATLFVDAILQRSH